MPRNFDIHDKETIQRAIEIDTKLSADFKPIFDRFQKNYDMVISRLQVDKSIKSDFNRDSRPYNAYNILSPVVKYLTSTERGGRKKIAALPRTEGDLQGALIATQLLDTLHYNTHLDKHRSRAFLDATIAGWGWLSDTWYFDNDAQGDLLIKAVSPLDLRFDMGEFNDTRLEHCRYIEYAPDMTLDEIILQYAENDSELMKEILTEGDKYFPEDSKERKQFISTVFKTVMDTLKDFSPFRNRYSENANIRNEYQWFNPINGKFKVIELHERRTKRRFLVYDTVREKYDDITDSVLSKDGYSEDKELVQQTMKNYPQSPEPRWSNLKQMWVTAVIPALELKVYDAPYAVQNGNFMFTMVPAYDFHPDMSYIQSPVEELIDLQSEYNKVRSTMIELLLRFSSLGYISEANNIEDEEAFATKKIGVVKYVKDINKTVPEKMPKIPGELFAGGSETRELVEYISGATRAAAHGVTDGKKESGILFKQKRDASVGMIQSLYDNLDNSTLQMTENSWGNVQKFMTEERTFRITQDTDKPEFMTVNQMQVTINEKGEVIKRILNDVTVGKYDFVMSNQPYGQTAREMAFMNLIDIFKLAIETDAESAKKMFPILLKASDTPYRQEMLEALGLIGEAKDKQEQVQQAMQALQMAYQQLGLEKGKAEIDDKKASANKKNAEAKATGDEVNLKRIDFVTSALQQQEENNQRSLLTMNG